MSEKIPHRGEYFYYIQIYTKKDLRTLKLNDILDTKKEIVKKYYYGLMGELNITGKIYNCLFWKNEKSAIRRITTIDFFLDGNNYEYKIKKLNREQFLTAIPDKLDESNYYYRGNKKLKEKEKEYLKRKKDE